MRIIALLLIPFALSYLYNLTFIVREDGIKVKYCVFGKPEKVVFYVNDQQVVFEATPKKVNISKETIEAVENLLKNGKNINIWELYNEPKLIRYDEFEKKKKEIEILEKLLKSGYFCSEKKFRTKVRKFYSSYFGKYIVEGNFEVWVPCSEEFEINGKKVCILRDYGVLLKLKEEKRDNMGVYIWIITSLLILTGLLVRLRRGIGRKS